MSKKGIVLTVAGIGLLGVAAYFLIKPTVAAAKAGLVPSPPVVSPGPSPTPTPSPVPGPKPP